MSFRAEGNDFCIKADTKLREFHISKMSYSLNDWDGAPKSTSTETLGVDRNKNREEGDDYGKLEKGYKKGARNTCLIVSLVLVVLLLITCIVLSIFLVKEVNKNGEAGTQLKKPSEDNEGGDQDLYCYSPDCLQIAAGFAQKMNSSFDPCEDFYLHSCASWMKENPIPPARNMYDTFVQVDDENSKRLRDILEETDELPEQSAVKKTRSYFESCLKEEEVEKDTNATLIPIIAKYGSWALDNETWNATQWKWSEILLPMIWDLTSTPLLEVAININPRNSSQHIITVSLRNLLPGKLISYVQNIYTQS